MFGHRNHKNAVQEQLSVKEEEHDPKGKFNGAKEVQYCLVLIVIVKVPCARNCS